MDTTTLDFNTLSLLIAVLGSTTISTLTIVSLMIRQFNRLNDKFTGQIAALDTKFTGQIAALDTKFTGKIDALDTKFTGQIAALDDKFTGKFDAMDRDVADVRERLARVEGHLMASEGFALRLPPPPAADEPPPADPPSDRRQAS